MLLEQFPEGYAVATSERTEPQVPWELKSSDLCMGLWEFWLEVV